MGLVGFRLNNLRKREEEVTGKNNDYWEGVFQYDINKDGSVPDYIPSEYPLVSGPSEDVNGKTIKGTKKRDVLNGEKKMTISMVKKVMMLSMERKEMTYF